jgi:hypothetical protein
VNKVRRRPSAAPRARSRSRVVAVLALATTAIIAQPPAPGLGQAVVRETQVALDADGTIFELTPAMRTAAGLFPEVQDFQVARLFRQDDGTLVLEVTSQAGQTVTRERRTLSAEDAAAFRQSVTASFAASDVAPTLDREGRGGLVWGATGLGLGFYGWAVPFAFDINDDKGAVAAYLLTAGSSFYLPYRLTRNRSVSDAHRAMALWGATRGALYGGALGFGITERGGLPDFEEDEEEWRTRWGTAMAGSVLGGVIGFKAVDWTSIDHGTASLRGTLGDFATAAGFGTSYVLGLYDDETVGERTENPDLLPANLLALGIGGAGLFASQAVGDGRTYTVGDVHVLRSFGLLGAQVLLPVAGLIDDDDAKTYVAAAILGGAPGLFVGGRVLRGQSFSGGDGLLVTAGHLAGGLIGAGVTYLLASDTSDNEVLYLATSALGSAAGLAFTYRALRSAGDGSAALPIQDRGSGSAPQVTLNAAGLFPLLVGRRSEGRPVQSSLVTIHW